MHSDFGLSTVLGVVSFFLINSLIPRGGNGSLGKVFGQPILRFLFYIFSQLSDGIRFNWPIKMPQLWEAKLSSSMLVFGKLLTQLLTCSNLYFHLIGQL